VRALNTNCRITVELLRFGRGKEKMNQSICEDQLYSPVEKFFKNRGYFTVSALSKKSGEVARSTFGVNVNGEMKKVDVAAFKWLDNHNIEAIAVECKLGKTCRHAGSALYQATAYQVLFPKVYVASQADLSELKHVESSLKQLGLGYILVKEEATMIFPSAENARFSQIEFNRQLRNRIAVLLAFNAVFGEEMEFGNAGNPEEIWVSNKRIQTCNMLMHLKENRAWMGLNIEKKEAVKRSLASLNTGDFHNLVSELDPEYSLVVRKFIGKQRLGKTEIWKKLSASKSTLTQLESIRSSILECLRNKDAGVDFQIIKDVETEALQNMTRESVIKEVQKMKQEIEPLYDLLKAPLVRG